MQFKTVKTKIKKGKRKCNKEYWIVKVEIVWGYYHYSVTSRERYCNKNKALKIINKLKTQELLKVISAEKFTKACIRAAHG